MSDLDAAVLAWCQSGGCIFTDERRASLVRFVRSTLAAAVAQEREENCRAIRAACGPCGGSGAVGGTGSGHGCDGTAENCAETCPVPVPDAQECEYCGRPIAAIRSRGAATRQGEV